MWPVHGSQLLSSKEQVERYKEQQSSKKGLKAPGGFIHTCGQGPATWDEDQKRHLTAKKQGSDGEGVISQLAIILPCDIESVRVSGFQFFDILSDNLQLSTLLFCGKYEPGAHFWPAGHWLSLCACSPGMAIWNTWAWPNVCSM